MPPASTTTATTPATPTAHPDIPPFPSPSTFSFLPDIWLLLVRLDLLNPERQHLRPLTEAQTQAQTNGHQQSTTNQTQQPLSVSLSISSSQQGQQASQNPPSTTPSQQSQALPPPPLPGAGAAATAPTTTTTTGAAATTTLFYGAPLLDLKDLPAQVYPLKQRLAKARAAVTALPDMDRTVAEQEDEIRRLERMIKGLKGRLARLGEVAAEAGSEQVRDVEMTDQEAKAGIEEGDTGVGEAGG
ncbi:hypothetical protein AYO21_06988 [Fonsecaea monophora]|uniref:Mediator of RNA polymerase II transcription subunit 9 n=1 Tax=Fonsecaea monophora TaxID=254056 RepID=A0A177F3D4_9EURO|nr:hypothetical protein AYO21_06988 [Fonsecaea monophora]OAG38793.1 hypothetical protein AYO21_06988 [Fonsecaea monophora]